MVPMPRKRSVVYPSERTHRGEHRGLVGVALAGRVALHGFDRDALT